MRWPLCTIRIYNPLQDDMGDRVDEDGVAQEVALVSPIFCKSMPRFFVCWFLFGVKHVYASPETVFE